MNLDLESLAYKIDKVVYLIEQDLDSIKLAGKLLRVLGSIKLSSIERILSLVRVKNKELVY